ncbi:hypothetical protein [Pseudovibrio denitrificans]|nr:hypothetical protein [Pseudovibrio denitrificans]
MPEQWFGVEAALMLGGDGVGLVPGRCWIGGPGHIATQLTPK